MHLQKLKRRAIRWAGGVFRIRAIVLLALVATLMTPGIVGAGEYLRFKILVVTYTDTFAGTATPSDVENVRKEVDEAVAFIWRSSRMRLHLAVDHLTIDRFVPESEFARSEPDRYSLPFWSVDDTGGGVAADLAGLGYRDGSYDIVVAFYAFERVPGISTPFGAGSFGVNNLLGRAGYIAIPMAWRPDTFNNYFEHEFLHVMRSIFKESGYTGFPEIHNVKLFQFLTGDQYPPLEPWNTESGSGYQSWMLGNFSDAEYFDVVEDWGSVRTYVDRDADGVPDFSPPGDALSITEETIGSSTDHADTDGDGLSDFDEVTAGLRSGSDPRNPDTDSDGLADGSDPDPLVASETEAP